MGISKALAKRAEEVFLNGHAIANTNFKELLESVTWRQATKKMCDLNTIALLTFHVNYYVAGQINVLKGGALEIRDIYSFDLSPINSEVDWLKLKQKFLLDAATYIEEVAQLSDGQLDEPFVDVRYGTYLRNIEGIIEHSYYHLGQISLIKKMIIEGKK
jgi:hypothetical protein